MVVSRRLPGQPSSVTIIKDASGRYFASFVVEVVPQPVAKVEAAVGIDLGLNHFAILSTGEKIGNLAAIRSYSSELNEQIKSCLSVKEILNAEEWLS
jgi:putative transposase